QLFCVRPRESGDRSNDLRAWHRRTKYQPKSWAGGRKKGVPSGPPIFGYYSAVIDESMFHVQVARQRHLTSGRGSKGNNFANIFTGLTTCAYCASPVRFHSKKRLEESHLFASIRRNGLHSGRVVLQEF